MTSPCVFSGSQMALCYSHHSAACFISFDNVISGSMSMSKLEILVDLKKKSTVFYIKKKNYPVNGRAG